MTVVRVYQFQLIRETQVGNYRAIIPTIRGQERITGFAQIVVDPDDSFPNGFAVGEIWGDAKEQPLAHELSQLD